MLATVIRYSFSNTTPDDLILSCYRVYAIDYSSFSHVPRDPSSLAFVETKSSDAIALYLLTTFWLFMGNFLVILDFISSILEALLIASDLQSDTLVLSPAFRFAGY